MISVMKSTTTASGISSFDTPAVTVGFNGLSAITLLAQVHAQLVCLQQTGRLNATGTGSSSIDILNVDTVSGTSSFDTPVNATATGTSTMVGSTLVTSIAGAGLALRWRSIYIYYI